MPATPGAHSYQISDTAVVRDAAAPISFDPHVTSVTVTGGDSPTAGDTFRVTPSTTTAFNVNGGLPNPPALPGDTLIVPQGGTLTQTIDRTTGASGNWQFAGDKPINFAGIEPAAAAATITSGNQTTFTTGVPGTFTIVSDGYPPPTFSETSQLQTFGSDARSRDGRAGRHAGRRLCQAQYQITITAHNGQGPDVTQDFTLLVAAPAPTARPDTFVLSGSASSSGAGTKGVLANDLSNDGQQQALAASLVRSARSWHADVACRRFVQLRTQCQLSRHRSLQLSGQRRCDGRQYGDGYAAFLHRQPGRQAVSSGAFGTRPRMAACSIGPG